MPRYRLNENDGRILKLPKSMQFEVYFNDDDEARSYIDIVEYLEYEPAAYIHEDGYLCQSPEDDDIEYFVAMDGRVDKKEDDHWDMGWGVQRDLRREYELLCAALDHPHGKPVIAVNK